MDFTNIKSSYLAKSEKFLGEFMGIISRFTDIMSANINAILSSSEEKNADKLLAKYLRDAQEDLQEVRSETATLMAQEAQAKRKLNECQENALKYVKYAEQAITAGNDADALKFIEAKNKENAVLADLQASVERATKNTLNMKQMATKLTSDIEEASDKLKELKAQLKLAEAMENVSALNAKMAGKSMGNFESLADSLQARIDKANATMDLNREMQGEEDGLDALMNKYSNNAPASPNSSMDELQALKTKLDKA